MRASGFFILLLVFAGAGCLFPDSGQHSHTAEASIEVERPENNGSVNILACTITFSDGQRCLLRGGDHAVVSLRSGDLWVVASSPDPYRLDSADSSVWRSPRFNFYVGPGETLRLSVEPKPEGSTYVGGWTIERAAKKIAGGKNHHASRLIVFGTLRCIGESSAAAADPHVRL